MSANSSATDSPPVSTIADSGKSRWASRTPEQKAADRADAMKYVRKGRPLPEGAAFFEVVHANTSRSAASAAKTAKR